MKKSKFTKALSSLICTAMIFLSIPATVVSYAAEPDIQSGTAEQQPAEDEQQPAEDEQQPVESEQQPVEDGQQPAEGEQPPAEDGQPPAEGEQPPVEDEQPPVENEQPPVEGEQQPVEGEQQPVEGEQQPVEGEQQPAEDEQPSAEEVQPLAEAEYKDYLYLSELNPTESKVGYGSLQLDSSASGQNIHLLVDGERTVFRKGIGAHATSTVIYDISAYSNTLTRFIAYLGIDARINGGNGVKFTISVSDDGQAWADLYHTDVVRSGQNAIYVDLDVTGKRYLKLYAYNNGSAGQDHSVYADARLKTAAYDPNVENKAPFKRLKEYDAILSQNTPEENLTSRLDLVYEREFVRRIGYNTLQNLYEDPQHQEAIEFLRTSKAAMSYFINGGPLVQGSGASAEYSMIAFSKIYAAHKADLTDSAENNFCLRLAVSVASAYSYPENVRFWERPNKEENPVTRYESFVTLSQPGGMMDQAGSSGGNSKWSAKEFRALPMPLMRWVVDTRMNEDEILWLANYALETRSRKPNKNFLDAYTYITYKTYNYSKPEYYAPENHTKWNDQYHFDKYFSDYGEPIRRQWILFQEGSVCGGLAKTYATLAEVFGRPSVVVGQPGHAATVTWEYDQNIQKYIWKIQNNISGWAQSHSEYRNYLLGWGASQYAKFQPSSYTLMASDAIADYDRYVQANAIVLLANSYAGTDEKVKLYESALQTQKINMDAWEGLVTAKLNDSSMSSEDYLDLAKRIMDELKYYPRAMEDLLLAIKGRITDSQHIARFDLYRLTALTDAEKATARESTQPSVCISVAQFLLNKDTTRLASFSFTGENAGAIMLDKKYDDSRIQVRYSLDGGQTWTETDEHKIQLSAEQLDQLTAENDIKVGLIGSDANYIIDIQTQKHPEPNTVYLNDRENLLFPGNDYLEYSVDGGATWQDYTLNLQSEERFTGKQTVQLRFRRNGVYLASDTAAYTFTEDTNTPERTYLPLNHVSLVSFSSQQTDPDRSAAHLIDGSGNSIWHSKYDIVDEKEYVVQFDQPCHISEVEYLPFTLNGRWKTVQIYTSMNQTDWTLVGESSLPNNDRLKSIPLNSDLPAKYLKVKGLDSWGSPENKYFSGKMLNFYVDTTKSPLTPAAVSYSITDKTNQNVVATITLPEGCRMLEGEPTYTFEQNGVHTFRYEDPHKNACEVTAEVTWIRKADLSGIITYSTTAPTRDNVAAEISGFAFQDVYVKNNDHSPTHTFTENGEFVFELIDSYGNTGSVKAVVQNIDRTAPKAQIEYSTTDWTGGDVTATLKAENGETYTILNNEGKDTYTFTKNGSFTFEIQDEAQNTSKVIAAVDWIDKSKDQIKPEASQKVQPWDPVTITLNIDPTAHEIVNNNGLNTYTFHKNGTFVFNIRLKDSGRVVSYEVKVDSISARPDAPDAPVTPNTPDAPNTPDGQNPSGPAQQPDAGNPDPGKNPATGDETNLLFPVLGIFGSAAVLFILLKRKHA